MKKVIGWIAVSISVFSLAPSVVPGAMSLMGLLASILALVLSVFSVEKGKRVYFTATFIIVIIGILVANDTLRMVGAIQGIPVLFKLSAYGVSFLAIAGCMFWANKLFNRVINT